MKSEELKNRRKLLENTVERVKQVTVQQAILQNAYKFSSVIDCDIKLPGMKSMKIINNSNFK